MASGDTLAVFLANSGVPEAAAACGQGTRNEHPILEFDAAADETIRFAGWLPANYAGGGITVTVVWAAASATSGNVVWNGAFEALADGGTDIDSDSFAAAQSVTVGAPGTSGVLDYADIAFTDAQIDGLVADTAFRFELTRDADNGSDTMTGDAQVLRVILTET